MASPSGREEWADVVLMSDVRALASGRARAAATFAAGLAALATSALLRLRSGRLRGAARPVTTPTAPRA